jgi:dinuclear metal center YbgI/SA1388 family protein
MKIGAICNYLESLAPRSWQESYDNSGLIVGDPEEEVKGVLVALDCIEAVVDEAIARGANLVVAHHPIVFKGLKQLNGKNYVERTVLKAIRHGVALYAIHTNFDHYFHGVNEEICERLGLQNLRILAPKTELLNKLAWFVPVEAADQVAEAVFEAGAGKIGNYDQCGFSFEGQGSFRPLEGANPAEGEIGKRHNLREVRMEVVVRADNAARVIQAMKQAHPYEEVAYDLIPLLNENQRVGAGMVGELREAMEEKQFLAQVKETFHCGVIRHTALLNKPVKRVAVCGGAGSFLIKDALRAGADMFLTGDLKYHEFFDAEQRVVLADIGHFESEQFTSQRLAALLKKKFTTFAVHLTEVQTNPINYF